jgi:hypothetical protein
VRALGRINANRAFNKILKLLNSGDERVTLMAAIEILDRAYGARGAGKLATKFVPSS